MQHTRGQLLTKKQQMRKFLYPTLQPPTSLPSSPCWFVPVAASVSKLLRPGECWDKGTAPDLRGVGVRLPFACDLTLAVVNGSVGGWVGGRAK